MRSNESLGLIKYLCDFSKHGLKQGLEQGLEQGREQGQGQGQGIWEESL